MKQINIGPQLCMVCPDFFGLGEKEKMLSK